MSALLRHGGEDGSGGGAKNDGELYVYECMTIVSESVYFCNVFIRLLLGGTIGGRTRASG